MLRYAHLDMKGGNRTFAALCIEVCCADFADLRCFSTDGRCWRFATLVMVVCPLPLKGDLSEYAACKAVIYVDAQQNFGTLFCEQLTLTVTAFDVMDQGFSDGA